MEAAAKRKGRDGSWGRRWLRNDKVNWVGPEHIASSHGEDACHALKPEVASDAFLRRKTSLFLYINRENGLKLFSLSFQISKK
jgi:hypothetical protein